MPTLEEKIDKLVQADRACDICKYNYDCNHHVSSGPDGPLYPKCADSGYDTCVDEDLVDEEYELLTEEENDQ